MTPRKLFYSCPEQIQSTRNTSQSTSPVFMHWIHIKWTLSNLNYLEPLFHFFFITYVLLDAILTTTINSILKWIKWFPNQLHKNRKYETLTEHCRGRSWSLTSATSKMGNLSCWWSITIEYSYPLLTQI